MRIVIVVLLLFAAALLMLYAYPWQKFAATSAVPPSPEPLLVATPPTITLSFVGDVMFVSSVGTLAARDGVESILADVAGIFQEDDLTMANLECVASTLGTAAEKQYTFRMNPAWLPDVKTAGIDAVTLANNHTLDYGTVAMLDMLDHLRSEGIVYVGGGETITEASAAQYLTVKGTRFALLAASRVLPSVDWAAGARHPGLLSAYDPSRLEAAIQQASAEATFVIVYLHWGEERARIPNAVQRTLAQRAIDAGADLVVGSHPHVLQGFGSYRQKLIAYSLGNFVFYNARKDSMILQVRFQGEEISGARVIPCRIINSRPQVLRKPAEATALLRELHGLSEEVAVGTDGELSW